MNERVLSLRFVILPLSPAAACLIGLVAVGLVTHLLYLSQPHSVVFDEFYFGKFATAYCCTGERFFDIHPPHAKLLIALAAKLGGYRGGFGFDHIGLDYGTTPVWALRFVPALSGILLPPLAFVLLRQLGGSLGASLVAGLALLFDNALTVQTRIIALDGVLLLSMLGAISLFLSADALPREWELRRALRLSFAGGAAALAVGTKFTGMVAPALLGLLVLDAVRKDLSRENLVFWVRHCVWIAAGFAYVYLLGWIIHFALLVKPGEGDQFQRLTGSFPYDFIKAHVTMIQANAGIRTPHSSASQWWSWPVMQRGVFYWSNDESRRVFFLGNPAVWWGSGLGLVAALATVLLRLRRGARSLNPKAWLPIAGYFMCYLPLMRVERPLFLYHYLPPLLFAIVLSALWLDDRGWTREAPISRQPRAFYVISALLILGFVLVLPLTLGGILSPGWTRLLTTVLPGRDL